MIITKKQFVTYINRIQRINEFNSQIRQFIRKQEPDFKWNPPTLDVELCSLLEQMFDVDDETIYWFCYEIDFGKDYQTGDNIYDGREYPLRSPEQLYDYLVARLEHGEG